MGLLKSVKHVPGIDYYEYREYDYWDRFKYRARLAIPGVRFTYWASNVLEWKDRVNNGRFNRMTDSKKAEVLQNAEIIKKFLEFRNFHKKQKERQVYIRIEGETTAIFSNDLQLLHDLNKWGVQIDFTEVIKNDFSGVKTFVNEPKNKYRVYFKAKRIEQTVQSDLRKMLEVNTLLFPSNAFTKWLNGDARSPWKSRWLSSAYFIDYNDESTLSYLALMHGDILGRKYKLEKRPDTE